jgi:ribose-phosphate pyrophosphokinase
MIITGGTIEAALKAVVSAGAEARASVVATHGLFVGPAAKRLATLPILRLLITDNLQIAAERELPIEVISLPPLLAQVISRLRNRESLEDLLAAD